MRPAPPASHPANDNADGAAAPTMIEAAIALAGGRRASVALRLDPARHLQLRLACVLGGRSAQAILSDALDDYLRTIPDLAPLLAGLAIDGGIAAATMRGTER